MPRIVFMDQPLHPKLNDGPAALLPASLAFDLLYLVTRRRSFAQAARYTLVGAGVTGAMAAAAGLADYSELGGESEARRLGSIHGLMNAGLLGLTAINLLLRRGRASPSGSGPFLLNLVANVGLAVSGWFGAQMVFGEGVGVGRAAGALQLEVPSEDRITEPIERGQEVVA